MKSRPEIKASPRKLHIRFFLHHAAPSHLLIQGGGSNHIMDRPKLSLLVPVYNAECYLADCLHSISSQLDERSELVVYDDASFDGSLNILHHHSLVKPLRIIKGTRNQGVAIARNQLLQHARGEYVWFIDADDLMNEGAYNKILDVLCKSTADIDLVQTGYNIIQQGGHKLKHREGLIGKKREPRLNRAPEWDLLYGISRTNNNYLWNKIFKRRLAEGLSFQQRVNFEDIRFLTDLLLRCEVYYWLPDALVSYRVHRGSTTHRAADTKYIDDYMSACIDRVESWQQVASGSTNQRLTLDLQKMAAQAYYRTTRELMRADKPNLTVLHHLYSKYFDTFNLYAENSKHIAGVWREPKLFIQWRKVVLWQRRLATNKI